MLARAVARVAAIVTRTEPPQVFSEIGRHPRLFRAWLPFAGALLLRGALPRVDSELVILRTASNVGCAYEREQHLALARRAGLSDAQVAAAGQGGAAEVWTDRQRLLLDAADQLHADRRIEPPTRTALEVELSPEQLVELCFLVGHYEMIAMLLETKQVAPDRPVRTRK